MMTEQELAIRVLASMRTSWARDAAALRNIGRNLENAERQQRPWQGVKLRDVSAKMKSAVQMVTEVIAALNKPVEVRGDSVRSATSPD